MADASVLAARSAQDGGPVPHLHPSLHSLRPPPLHSSRASGLTCGRAGGALPHV